MVKDKGFVSEHQQNLDSRMKKIHQPSIKLLVKSDVNINGFQKLQQANRSETHAIKAHCKQRKISVCSDSPLFNSSKEELTNPTSGSRKNSVSSIQEEEEEEENENESIEQESKNNFDYIRCINCNNNNKTSIGNYFKTLENCYRCRHLKSIDEPISVSLSFKAERRRSLQELTVIPERICDNETDNTVKLQKLVEKEVSKLLWLNKNRYNESDSLGRRKSIN